MAGCGCEFEAVSKEQSKVLIILLLINAVMFVIEASVGWLAESTALIADSLDMLADAVVYGIGLYAVGKAATAKIKAATLSGWFQILMGLAIMLDVVRRYIGGSEPEPAYMLAIGTLALMANLLCLKLLSKHRDGEVHMRASWIFSKNDVIANLGILLAAVLVEVFTSNLPDLITGFIVALLVVRGGKMILADAAAERQACC